MASIPKKITFILVSEKTVNNLQRLVLGLDLAMEQKFNVNEREEWAQLKGEIMGLDKEDS